MTALRVTAFNLFFYGYTFAIALTCYALAKLSTRERMQRVLGHWGRTVRAAVALLLGGRIEVRGEERLPPGGPRLLVAKHQSELDVVMLAALMPNASAVAMAELTKYPFFGPILETLGVVLVAVDAGPQGRTRQVVEGARRVAIEEDRPMMIYPEGELMRLGARERYRKGAAHIYTALGIPAYPVAVSHGLIWPRREWRKRVGRRAVFEFLEPIQPGLGFDDFMAEIERRIEENTMRLIREDAPPDELAAAERRYAGRLNNRGEPVAAALAEPPEGPGPG